MKQSYSTLLSGFLILATGNVNGTKLASTQTTTTTDADLTFVSGVQTTVFDPSDGTFYAGLASGASTYSISRALRPIFGADPKFTALGATGAGLSDSAIEMLSLVGNQNSDASNLALVVQNPIATFTQTRTSYLNSSGTIYRQSSPLNDASGAVGTSGATTTGIVSLNSNKPFMFAVVRPTTNAYFSAFGDLNSGIAVVGINPVNFLLTQTASQLGDPAIKATKLDPTIAPVRITNNPFLQPNYATMAWDEQLSRLYTGISATTAGAPGDGTRSLVVGQVSPSGVLELYSSIPDGSLVAGQNDAIIGVIQGATALSVTASKIGVMHASTGPSYVIINGGNDVPDVTNNLVYALPLVDLDQSTNPSQGLIASRTGYNSTTHRFETPVVTNADLTLSSDDEALVGAGELPAQAITGISHMQVIGDCVYASIASEDSALDSPGVFFSQALFNAEGRIVRWTPWTKRAFPANGFPDQPTTSSVSQFAVDAQSGITWAVGSTNNRAVRISGWDGDENNLTSLTAQVSAHLLNGAYSVLDLDQSTRGFVGANLDRYALFGGASKVVFTRISHALGATIESPQTTLSDFSDAQNLHVSSLPITAGPVTVMEYSRQLSGLPNNYFFAGTQSGLYVAADNTGNGFDTASLTTVNAAPIAAFIWYKIPTIPGSIVDIKTSGNTLYVMSQQTTSASPFKTRVYRFDYTSNIATLFAAPIVIAETNIGAFANSIFFSKMDIVTNNDTGSEEQLIVATNNGLFYSSRVGGVQAATSQPDAGWQPVPDSDGVYFNGIGSVDNAQIPLTPTSTLWPFAITSETDCNFFQNGTFYQLAATGAAPAPEFVPEDFVSDEDKQMGFGPLRYFWSDGARRFMVVNNTQDSSSSLAISPYTTTQMNVVDASSQIISNPVTDYYQNYYWIRAIGTTGLIVAGTDEGIIALS